MRLLYAILTSLKRILTSVLHCICAAFGNQKFQNWLLEKSTIIILQMFICIFSKKTKNFIVLMISVISATLKNITTGSNTKSFKTI